MFNSWRVQNPDHGVWVVAPVPSVRIAFVFKLIDQVVFFFPAARQFIAGKLPKAVSQSGGFLSGFDDLSMIPDALGSDITHIPLAITC